MDSRSRSLGVAGEAEAARWLRGAGLTIVGTGFRARCGEIDVIAEDGREVVFVEVKTRTSDAFGTPAESVTRLKRVRIVRAASVFLVRAGWTDRPCRFDVLSIVPVGAGFRVTHLKDAFRQGD
jgi:putative endonuclease